MLDVDAQVDSAVSCAFATWPIWATGKSLKRFAYRLPSSSRGIAGTFSRSYGRTYSGDPVLGERRRAPITRGLAKSQPAEYP